MRITILGSGTCIPRLDRRASAVLVEIGAAKILLDIGLGTLHRLLECGITIFDLTHIFISHFHPDHTCELVPLIFAIKYPDGPNRSNPLCIFGGTGIAKLYQGLQNAYGQWIVLPENQLVIKEITASQDGMLEFDHFTVTTRPVLHRPESIAYRIQSRKGPSIVYSGDTDECDALTELAVETDLMICESAMPDGQKVPGHLTPSIAGRIAAGAGAKQLVLTHLYPPCDQVDIVKQARSTYKGPVIAAEDLMTFCL